MYNIDLQNIIMDIITINDQVFHRDSSFEYIKAELIKRNLNIEDNILDKNLNDLSNGTGFENDKIIKIPKLRKFLLKEIDSSVKQDQPWYWSYSLRTE